MTGVQKRLLDQVNKFCSEERFDFEEYLEQLAGIFEQWEKNWVEKEPTVASCYKTAAQHLHEASMAYYVSTK